MGTAGEGAFSLLALFCLLFSWAEAFNKEDNYHGYTGRCPDDWREIDQYCYKIKDDGRDFRDALDACTVHKDRDSFRNFWSNGHNSYSGIRHNLMPVPLLHSMKEHGQRAFPHLGRGPYRVNAIKTSYDHKWREFDGGNTNIDVYKWRGGREVDFSLFPDFNTHWGEPGDTLVWYPNSNRLYARPHYHKYESLCYRRKKDAERCPGVPECNYHGDCYHGKCFCYEGWVGDDCCCKPKLLIIGGEGDDANFEPEWYAELFDFHNMSSCVHSEFPDAVYGGEAEVVAETVMYCGGEIPAGNVSYCIQWNTKDHMWEPTPDDATYPMINMDSVVAYQQDDYCERKGWWLLNGIEGTTKIQPETQVVYFDDVYDWEDGPSLQEWRQDFCAVMLNDFELAVIGGQGSTGADDLNAIEIYDIFRDDWRDGPAIPGDGFQNHECELVMDPHCGHPTVVIIGSEETGITNVWTWDTVTDEFREAETLPTSTKNLYDHETVKISDDTIVVIGGYDGSDSLTDIWTYKLGKGFTKVGNMLQARYDHAAVVVWGDDHHCPVMEITPTPGP